MRVLRLNDAGLSAAEAAVPSPGKFELLIRVSAAGITPSELEWYPTTHTKSGERRQGAIPSHEFSGVVAGIGECVGAWNSGGRSSA